MSESRTLVREREMRARAWREKSRLYSEERQVPGRRGRAGKQSLPKKCRRKHELVSGRQSSPGRSGKSWFHSKSGQTWNGKTMLVSRFAKKFAQQANLRTGNDGMWGKLITWKDTSVIRSIWIPYSSYEIRNLDAIDSALSGHFGHGWFCPNQADK